jgi:heme-degrading monooxygenase HmoA
MLAVIFRARINELDEDYHATATRMRELAMDKYGCIEFNSVSEGDEEIAISYWHNEDDIKAWKADAEHRAAQKKGRNKWYRSYRVDITHIERSYSEKQ